MIRHMRHGSSPGLMALQPPRPQPLGSLCDPSAGDRMRAAGAQCSCRTALAIAVRWRLQQGSKQQKTWFSGRQPWLAIRGALLQGLVVLTRAHRFARLLTASHGLWRVGNDVAAPVCVIGQLVPRQRVMLLAEAEEAAKAHDSIGDLT